MTIESPADTTRDPSTLEPFSDALNGDERVSGPATTVDVANGTIGATFQVNAETVDDAALVACLAYWRAIAAAGLDLNDYSRVEVQSADADADNPTSYEARPDVRPAR